LLQAYQPQPRQFLVFRAAHGNGGLGDRLVGATSSFVLALLTQRHFRILWTDPFPLCAVWEPASGAVAWDQADFAGLPFRELAAVGQMPALANFFAEHDLGQEFPGNVVIEANQHFYTHLLKNRHLAEAVRAYRFPDPAELCSQILSALFRPVAEVRDALDRCASALWGRHSVGLQIRTLWNWGDGGGRLAEEELAHFFSCAAGLLSNSPNDVVFVSTDEGTIIDRVRDRFPRTEVWALPNPILHVDRSAWAALADYRATFLNLHLLGACRHLVVSHWSNLGRLAALMARRRPWVTRKGGSSADFPLTGTHRRAELHELLSKEGLA
jgi:hypothetical protein